LYNNKKLSLNLAGGGARGCISLGYMKAWNDLKLKADMVWGTSVGALGGCLFQQNELDKLEQMWMTISNDKVYKFHWWTVPQLLLTRNHLYDSTPLKNLIDQLVDHEKIVANPIPFYITATNLTDWTDETYLASDLTEDEFKTFLLASASPPAAFAPVYFPKTGKMYCDGGITNNFGPAVSIKWGADIIVIATPTVRDASQFENEIDMFSFLTSVPEYCYLARELSYIDLINKIQDPFPNLRYIKHILIRPETPSGISLLNFTYPKPIETYINMGYNLALDTLNRELLCTDQT
jgi:predicted acylesterase/phospholipase RssA